MLRLQVDDTALLRDSQVEGRGAVEEELGSGVPQAAPQSMAHGLPLPGHGRAPLEATLHPTGQAGSQRVHVVAVDLVEKEACE